MPGDGEVAGLLALMLLTEARGLALAAVDPLEHKLAGYHAYHATRADLLRRLGRNQQSRAAYDKAIELAGNTAETAYLTRRRDQRGSTHGSPVRHTATVPNS